MQSKLMPANRSNMVKAGNLQKRYLAERDSNLSSDEDHTEDSQPEKLSTTGFGIRINQDNLCSELVYGSSSFSRYHGKLKAVF